MVTIGVTDFFNSDLQAWPQILREIKSKHGTKLFRLSNQSRPVSLVPHF